MKIGLLGGSFDPIHNGHIYMAQMALKQFHFDELWLIPAGHSPNKKESEMTSAKLRQEMCNLACESIPNIKVCSIEVDSNDTSYTYLTLQKLKDKYPNTEFYFIMGADSLAYFEKWVHPEIISQLAHILVVNRNEYSFEQLDAMVRNIQNVFPCTIDFVMCDKYNISSSQIRKKIKDNLDVSNDLPKKVYSYIKNNQLYK